MENISITQEGNLQATVINRIGEVRKEKNLLFETKERKMGKLDRLLEFNK